MNACTFCGDPCRGSTCQGHADLRQSDAVFDDPDTDLLVCEFTVEGEPIPQGSKTRTRFSVREDNPRTRPWRTAVGYESHAAMGGRDPVVGPLHLYVRFFFNRPKSHYGSGRNAFTLKPSAPQHHTSKPDADKLLRAIGDAVTGTVVRDDSQFAIVSAEKLYGRPRAHIMVFRLAHDLSPPPVTLHAA